MTTSFRIFWLIAFTAVFSLMTGGSALAESACLLTFRSSKQLLGSNQQNLSCALDRSNAPQFGIVTRQGKFKSLAWKAFLKLVRSGKGSKRNLPEPKLKNIFNNRKLLCTSQKLGNSFPAVFQTSGNCSKAVIPPLDPIVTATPHPSQTATATPTATFTPTFTPTPTSTPTVEAQLFLSDESYEFGTIGIGETRHHSIVVRPQQGSPFIVNVETQTANGISLLTPSEVVTRGGIPCSGLLTQFCVIMLKLEADSIGDKDLTLKISYRDAPTSNAIGHRFVTATAHVQSAATSSLTDFKTISIRSLSQAVGKTPLQYLQAEFDRIAPASYDSEDPFLFDSYTSNGTSQWKSNWANSVFDFSGVAWDQHMAGTAITRCHVVYARHFPRSGNITFTKKDGTPFTSTIIGTFDFPNPNTTTYDITVARINPCLPQDWTVYPLVDGADVLTSTDLQTAPYINTHYNFADSIRRISVTRVAVVYPTLLAIIGSYNPSMPSFMQVMAVNGDSGNPSFYQVDGKLVLVSTFTQGGYGGTGPNYSAAAHQQMLRDAIASLP